MHVTLKNVVMKQVCTHGLVSFGSPITSTDGVIPRDTGPPFIAVNWRSFYTYDIIFVENKGRVYYRSNSSGRIVPKNILTDTEIPQCTVNYDTFDRKIMHSSYSNNDNNNDDDDNNNNNNNNNNKALEFVVGRFFMKLFETNNMEIIRLYSNRCSALSCQAY